MMDTLTTMSAEELLRAYTEADAAWLAFMAANDALMLERDRLEGIRAIAENRLKEGVRLALQPLENEVFIITVLAKAKKWYDADTVLRLAPYVAQMPGVMEVNRERINQLAKAKAIPDDVIAAAYREEALTPAVTIKRRGGADA